MCSGKYQCVPVFRSVLVFLCTNLNIIKICSGSLRKNVRKMSKGIHLLKFSFSNTKKVSSEVLGVWSVGGKVLGFA